MNEGLQLGFQFAKQCADNAGEEWKEMAYHGFVTYAKMNESFTTEEVKYAFPEIPEPHDKRAWGHIAKMAQKNKVVKGLGYVASKDKSKHGGTVTLWGKL